MACATTGASLVLATVSTKSSATEMPLPSVAVTFTLTRPTSPFAGVPEKVRVVALKLSQVGSAVPSARVAV